MNAPLRFRVAVFFVILAILPPPPALAIAWVITEPTAGATFGPFTDFDARGTAPKSTCYVVELQRNDGVDWVTEQSHSGTTPSDSCDWTERFTAPLFVGWNPDGSDRVILRKCGSAAVIKSVSITILAEEEQEVPPP